MARQDFCSIRDLICHTALKGHMAPGLSMPTPIDPTSSNTRSDTGQGARPTPPENAFRPVGGPSIDANRFDGGLTPRVQPPALIAGGHTRLPIQLRNSASHSNTFAPELSKPSSPSPELTCQSKPAISVTAHTFKPITASVRNSRHGRLKTSVEKPNEGNVVEIEVTLTDLSNREFRFLHRTYVVARDLSVDGKSSIGFGDIELPEPMKGKGVMPAYLRSLARAGIKLGVDEVAVDLVIGDELHKLLSNLKMTQTVHGYHLPPADLLRNLDKGQATANPGKKWESMPSQVDSVPSSQSAAAPERPKRSSDIRRAADAQSIDPTAGNQKLQVLPPQSVPAAIRGAGTSYELKMHVPFARRDGKWSFNPLPIKLGRTPSGSLAASQPTTQSGSGPVDAAITHHSPVAEHASIGPSLAAGLADPITSEKQEGVSRLHEE